MPATGDAPHGASERRQAAAEVEDAVLTTDPAGAITFCSPAAERLLGCTAQDAVGRSLLAFVDPCELGDRATALGVSADLAALAGARGRWTCVRPDGGRVEVTQTLAPLRGPAGDAGFVWIARPAVARSAADALATFDASPIPTAITRVADGVIVFVNVACRELLGLDAADAVGRTMLDAGFWSRPERRAAMLDELAARGHVRDLEEEITARDGERMVVLVSIQPLELDGEPYLIGHIHDITARRALEQQLRESEKLYRLLAEYSTDVIGRLSGDGRIEYVSPASRSVYGYPPEEMVGRFGHEFIHPDDLAAMSEDFSEQGRPGPRGIITNSYRVRRGDGEYVWIEARIRPLRDPDTGEVVEFHTVARDIADRMQAEAEVRRAKEEAELANAAKSEFLSRMSHELRTPLHAILGFGDLLERDDLTDHQHEQLVQITRAGRHLLELINEVLDLTRIEDGALPLSLEPVDVARLVGEALQMLEPIAAAHAVALVAPRVEAAQLHVQADRQRLKQVLLNLLSNAVKYNRPGGEVRVAATRRAPPVTRIEVADTGIGIAEGDIARAFSAFERLGAETTDVEGTGLGLALAKRLVEAMGGTIGVESEVGRGTTFWIELPEVAPPAPRAARSERPPATRARPARTDARTVLYVEDNPSNVKLVETILRERPEVTLLVAQQGRLGLELARDHAPALVLLDLNLPDVSGEEILRRLRADERTAAIRIVMVSADATPGQVARLLDAGADAYLTKPFQIEDFLAVVDGLPLAATAVPAEPPESAAALDRSTVDKLMRLHPDGRAVRELIDIYLADAPVRLAELAGAVAANDAEAVRRTAHAWRGACAMTGARRLVALLADIEALARAGAIPNADELSAVREAYDEARCALNEQFP